MNAETWAYDKGMEVWSKVVQVLMYSVGCYSLMRSYVLMYQLLRIRANGDNRKLSNLSCIDDVCLYFLAVVSVFPNAALFQDLKGR